MNDYSSEYTKQNLEKDGKSLVTATVQYPVSSATRVDLAAWEKLYMRNLSLNRTDGEVILDNNN